MPRIDQTITHAVFFLYASKEEAARGRNAHGTGFVASIPVYGEPHFFYYGVTNKHVIQSGAVVRLNTNTGVEIFDLDPADWQIDPDNDIAVVRLLVDGGARRLGAISITAFLDKKYPDVGLGDDVFMIGLFVDSQNKDSNSPVARFGSVSMLATESAPIDNGLGQRYESYVVDMHSRGGFSGSPVFVYQTIGSDLTRGFFGIDVTIEFGGMANGIPGFGEPAKLHTRNSLKLLGIHWGQFPEQWEAIAEDGRKSRVRGVSGMTCVAPAWSIAGMLFTEHFAGERRSEMMASLNDVNGQD